uniref:COP9 signalosome complex subunit 9 n=1 Tax=Zosterops lateralis melanops TaxID=1220523 RepID=A0A8D2NQX2_ZOSLA
GVLCVQELFKQCAQRLLSQAGGSTGLLMDLAANEKAVHADFFNGKGRRAPGVSQHASPGFPLVALVPGGR